MNKVTTSATSLMLQLYRTMQTL